MRIKIVPENLAERIALAFNLAPVPLLDTQVAFTAARAIMAAADTGIFEALGKGRKTSAQVADQCKLNAVAAKHLLDCLVGIGYLKWSNEQYALKPKFYKWLLAEYSTNFTGKLRFQISEWNWVGQLEQFVRTGEPLELHKTITKDEWAIYQEGMRDVSIKASEELAQKLKLPASATKMLDIGGSHGLFSIELCKRNPSLSSTILELPGAIESAKAIAARHGLNERIQYRAGNALEEDLGEQQYDLVMINNVVHHFTREQNMKLASKVARALKPNGLYGIGDVIRQQKPGEGGAVASTFGLYFALTSSSGTWSVQEINSWQQHAGLKPQKPVSLMSLPGWKMLPAQK